MAAQRGDVESQMTLGVQYCSNAGVPFDLIQCYAWLSTSLYNPDVFSALSNQKKTTAQLDLNKLFVSFSDDQKIEAIRLAEVL